MEQLICRVSLEGEIWKPVKGFEQRYWISDFGRVFSFRKKGLLKLSNCFGYHKVSLQKENVSRQLNVHRLVAEAFVENLNPEKFNIVNHLDNNGFNNRKENLEWVDVKGNSKHAAELELKRKGRSVIQLDLKDNFIKEYESIIEASKESGISTATIKRNCAGKVSRPRKYKWKYKEDVEKDEEPDGKQIDGYSKYILTRDGKIYSINKKIFVKPIHPYRGGYPYVSLYGDNGEHKNLVIHRLVAEYYIENKDGLPCVNHINGDKNDYNISNLEWATFKENSQHAVDNDLIKNKKSVIRFDIKTKRELGRYPSISHACRELKLSECNRSHISSVCSGKRKSTAGYGWKYV